MNMLFFVQDICRMLFMGGSLGACAILGGSLLNSITALFDMMKINYASPDPHHQWV